LKLIVLVVIFQAKTINNVARTRVSCTLFRCYLKAIINNKLAALNLSDYNAKMIMNRAEAMSCGGCHQNSSNAEIAPNVKWPFYLLFFASNLPIKLLEQVKIAWLMLEIDCRAHQHGQKTYSVAI
jgi:hypothetical protein